MQSIKQGSGKYRSILQKKLVQKDLHSPANWRSKINDNTITSKDIKQTRKNLQSRYLGSDTVDILSRLKMGKTLFRNQLQHIGSLETLYCPICIRESNMEIPEDLTHATFSCPYVNTVINEITTTFFPNLQSPFTHKDILLSITANHHTLYEGKPGQILTSLVWDHVIKYLMVARGKNVTPIPAAAIVEVKTQINRILKKLPKTCVKHRYFERNLSELTSNSLITLARLKLLTVKCSYIYILGSYAILT